MYVHIYWLSYDAVLFLIFFLGSHLLTPARPFCFKKRFYGVVSCFFPSRNLWGISCVPGTDTCLHLSIHPSLDLALSLSLSLSLSICLSVYLSLRLAFTHASCVHVTITYTLAPVHVLSYTSMHSRAHTHSP